MKKIQVLLIAAICLLLGYAAGTAKVRLDWQHNLPQLSVISKEPPADLANVDATPLWAVWEKVDQLYYDKKALDSKKMLNGAIDGMVKSIGDPYTMYLPPAQNGSFKQQLAGQFSGIGAELGLNNSKQIIVIAPLAGSPAESKGIKAGDIVLKVDGQSTDNWSLTQAVDKIRGPKGTTVALTILHKDDKNSTDLSIKRDTITVKSVDGWIKNVKDIDAISSTLKSSTASNDKIVYIRLAQFGDRTDQEWTDLMTSFQKQIQTDKTIKGIILDERNNPGGYLKDAQFIAGEFLPQNAPVVIQDAGNGNTQTLYVDRQGSLQSLPLIVLLNGGSASASEIVAGALRDADRAKLAGEKSFGKGTIQTVEDLGGGAGLHVTIAKWLTPKGTWVHGKGLEPDIAVTLDPKDPSHDTQLEKSIQALVQ